MKKLKEGKYILVPEVNYYTGTLESNCKWQWLCYL